MKTNEEVLTNLHEDVKSEFDWEQSVLYLLDMTRWALLRNDYREASRYTYVLGFLGVGLEDLGLSLSVLNNIAKELISR